MVNVSVRFICSFVVSLSNTKTDPQNSTRGSSKFRGDSGGSTSNWGVGGGAGAEDHVQLNINILLRDVHGLYDALIPAHDSEGKRVRTPKLTSLCKKRMRRSACS